MFRATAGGLRCKVFASEVPRCKEVEGADNIKRPLRPLFLFLRCALVCLEYSLWVKVREVMFRLGRLALSVVEGVGNSVV